MQHCKFERHFRFINRHQLSLDLFKIYVLEYVSLSTKLFKTNKQIQTFLINLLTKNHQKLMINLFDLNKIMISVFRKVDFV